MYGNFQLLRILRNCLDHSVTWVRKFPKNPYTLCAPPMQYIHSEKSAWPCTYAIKITQTLSVTYGEKQK